MSEMSLQQITLAEDVFRICLKPVYITRGEPQDASLGNLKIAHNPPLLYSLIIKYGEDQLRLLVSLSQVMEMKSGLRFSPQI